MKKFGFQHVTRQNVVHMGKKKKKEIKKYRRGYGEMHLEVEHIIEQAKSIYGEDKEIVPIVIVHKRKGKKKGLPESINITPLVKWMT